MRQNRATKQVLGMVAEMRRRQQASLPAGFVLTYVRDLKVGDVVVSEAFLKPLFTVTRMQAAVAKNYVVIDGENNYRTSRHLLDDLIVAVEAK